MPLKYKDLTIRRGINDYTFESKNIVSITTHDGY